MKIIFIGPPGAGKGLQGKIFSKELKIPAISTGDIFRDLAVECNALGFEAKEKYWGRGNLVPDSITIKLVENRLTKKDCNFGYILDGFPRTLPQAESLEKITEVDHVFNFQISDEYVKKRLPHRKHCKDCKIVYGKGELAPTRANICNECNKPLFKRDDDQNSEVVENRLKIYNEEIEQITDFYRSKVLLRNIDANQDYKTLSNDIRLFLNKW